MAKRRPFEELRAVVALVTYPGFEFLLSQDGEGDTATAWVQIMCPGGVDTVTGDPMPWKARKWKVSFYSTDTEIVQTLWAAVQRALIHEASELFRFTGEAIFDRHLDVYQLAYLAGGAYSRDGREG